MSSTSQDWKKTKAGKRPDNQIMLASDFNKKVDAKMDGLGTLVETHPTGRRAVTSERYRAALEVISEQNPPPFFVGDKFPDVILSSGHASTRPLEVKDIDKMIAYLKPQFRLVVTGIIRGGKNNIIVTRTGHRFPRASWAKWRDKAVAEIKNQLPKDFHTITEPVNVRIDYIAGDKRRRDFPAICDAIWCVMEKAGVVSDDTLLWPAESTRNYSKENPMAVITFLK